MAKSSSSDDGVVHFSMLSGATSAGPHVAAGFRLGDNSGAESGSYEFMLDHGSGDSPVPLARGHLTWDPAYRGQGDSLFSVAPVRLELTPGQVRWAVGTSDFIAASLPPYRWIEKIEVTAEAGGNVPGRLVQWDLLELAFQNGGPEWENVSSPCLPRVLTGQPLRRAAAAGTASNGGALRQYVQMVPHGHVQRIRLAGQITLRARGNGPAAEAPGPDDLQGRVLVFMDSGR